MPNTYFYSEIAAGSIDEGSLSASVPSGCLLVNLTNIQAFDVTVKIGITGQEEQVFSLAPHESHAVPLTQFFDTGANANGVPMTYFNAEVSTAPGPCNDAPLWTGGSCWRSASGRRT